MNHLIGFVPLVLAVYFIFKNWNPDNFCCIRSQRS